MLQFNVGQSGEVLEVYRIGVAGRQDVNQETFFHEFLNKVKSEFVDTPTGIRYKSNTFF